jgi:predicted GNAT family N-acyltransferase
MTTSSARTATTGSNEQLLTKADVPDALVLSTEAGWNQTTALAFPYDKRLAWIGMVLTKQEYRGQGHATSLMEKCLAYLDKRGSQCVKLDASDEGFPVYEKLGFVRERGVSRWVRRGNPDFMLRRAATQTWIEADDLALDRLMFGADRVALLQALAERETHWVPGQGFGMVRHGRVATQFGPCVAQTRQSLRKILEGVLNRHGGEDIYWDICDDNEDATNIAMAHGFVRQRRLTRMRRGGTAEHADIAFNIKLAALAGFEFG